MIKIAAADGNRETTMHLPTTLCLLNQGTTAELGRWTLPANHLVENGRLSSHLLARDTGVNRQMHLQGLLLDQGLRAALERGVDAISQDRGQPSGRHPLERHGSGQQQPQPDRQPSGPPTPTVQEENIHPSRRGIMGPQLQTNVPPAVSNRGAASPTSVPPSGPRGGQGRPMSNAPSGPSPTTGGPPSGPGGRRNEKQWQNLNSQMQSSNAAGQASRTPDVSFRGAAANRQHGFGVSSPMAGPSPASQMEPPLRPSNMSSRIDGPQSRPDSRIEQRQDLFQPASVTEAAATPPWVTAGTDVGGAKSAETERSETDVKVVERREGQEGRRHADQWRWRELSLGLPNPHIRRNGLATAAGADAEMGLLTTAGGAVAEASRRTTPGGRGCAGRKPVNETWRKIRFQQQMIATRDAFAGHSEEFGACDLLAEKTATKNVIDLRPPFPNAFRLLTASHAGSAVRQMVCDQAQETGQTMRPAKAYRGPSCRDRQNKLRE
ncbi:hypothetical protein KC328_g76 [Hortaea werneckii]|nr:hypothetical protein KC328_g76 [Hortaea werneckii]